MQSTLFTLPHSIVCLCCLASAHAAFAMCPAILWVLPKQWLISPSPLPWEGGESTVLSFQMKSRGTGSWCLLWSSSSQPAPTTLASKPLSQPSTGLWAPSHAGLHAVGYSSSSHSYCCVVAELSLSEWGTGSNYLVSASHCSGPHLKQASKS